MRRVISIDPFMGKWAQGPSRGEMDNPYEIGFYSLWAFCMGRLYKL